MKKAGTVIKWIMFSVLLIAEFVVMCIGIYLFFINQPQSFEEWFGEGSHGIIMRIVFLLFGLALFAGFDVVVFKILSWMFHTPQKSAKSQYKSSENITKQTQQNNITPYNRTQSESHREEKNMCRDCIYFRESDDILRTRYVCGRWTEIDDKTDKVKYFYVNPTSSCDMFCKKTTSSDSHFRR